MPAVENFKMKTALILPSLLMFASLSASLSAQAHIRIAPVGRMGTNDAAKFIQPDRTNPTVADAPSPCSTYTTPMANRLQLKSGQEFKFTITETINHPGRFYVQFKQDASQNFWTPSNELANVVDTGNRANTVVSITVPNVTCDSCMLRVLQQMDDQPGEYYVHCLDVKIAPAVASSTGGGGNNTQGTAELASSATEQKTKFGGCGMIAASSLPPSGPGGGMRVLGIFMLMSLPAIMAFRLRRQPQRVRRRR
jgi:hypothetical protein